MKGKCDSKPYSKKTARCAYYIGEAINIADNDKVTPELVKQRTKAQNNNPRNNID